MIPVQLPEPARFALHKLIVSTLRQPVFAIKMKKDQRQAAVLIEAILGRYPESLDTAVAALDPASLPRVARAADHAQAQAEDLSDRSRDFLERLATLG